MASDMERAAQHLNGARSDKHTGRRYGALVSLHQMRSQRGTVRLALVCDCGAYVDATTATLDAGHAHCAPTSGFAAALTDPASPLRVAMGAK